MYIIENFDIISKSCGGTPAKHKVTNIMSKGGQQGRANYPIVSHHCIDAFYTFLLGNSCSCSFKSHHPVSGDFGCSEDKIRSN